MFAGAVVTFFGLIPSPKEIGLPDPDAEEGEIADADEESQDRDANNQGKTSLFLIASHTKKQP